MTGLAQPVSFCAARARPLDGSHPAPPVVRHWLWVMCLIGVDYFSGLAYLPSITFEVAGILGPVATLVVVALTLGGALPVYAYLAGRSPSGQGSIALLGDLMRGWRGKSLVLLLLGFAATDFVMTRTLSLADAAEHVIHNEWGPWQRTLDDLVSAIREDPWLSSWLGLNGNLGKQLLVTLLLGAICTGFWVCLRRGLTRRTIALAVLVVGMYLLLTGVVIGSGLLYLARHPDLVTAWYEQLQQGRWHPGRPPLATVHWMALAGLGMLLLPQLGLGLSGFETSLVAMPQIRGDDSDPPEQPRGRIRNTRKALVVLALLMALFLSASVLVTALLIPAAELLPGGQAANRALAYLAHGGKVVDGQAGQVLNPLFGALFGSLYDLSTVLILCFAGTNVMAALRGLLPQFLLRFGMILKWANAWGVLFLLFALVNLGVTLWFRASVQAQRGAYAVGVLVLLATAAGVTVLDRWRRRKGPWPLRFPWFCGLVLAFFGWMAVAQLVVNPSGLAIAAGFIAVLFATSVISRAARVGELRTVGFAFQDERSRREWERLKYLDFPVLVPHRPGRTGREEKEQRIRQEHQLTPDADVVFVEIEVEDASNFFQDLLVEVFREDRRSVIRVRRCVSVAHALAAVALEMSRFSKPPALHFGWPEMSLLEASWSYLVAGEGDVPWRVRELIHREEPRPENRPRVIVG